MEKVYRTVIIDDEESAIDSLCFELQRYCYISVEAPTVDRGLRVFSRCPMAIPGGIPLI